MERAEGLARALELARELKDDELVTRVASTMSAAADREMRAGRIGQVSRSGSCSHSSACHPNSVPLRSENS